MPEDYIKDSKEEANRMAEALKELNTLLITKNLDKMYGVDTSELREKIQNMLGKIIADINMLELVSKDNVFGTEPTLSKQTYDLIQRIEKTKVEFEFNILPSVENLTKVVLDHARQKPPDSSEFAGLASTSGGRWTTEKVLNEADQLVDKTSKVVGIATKAYGLAKILGLLVGVPLP